MRQYRFYKDENGWFIDLKWFPFNKAYLAMVAGADTLLDKLSDNGDEVDLLIDTHPIPFSSGTLEKVEDVPNQTLFSGRFYEDKAGFTDEVERPIIEIIWLCAVTLWVFWKYPKKIYYKIVK